MLAYNKDDYNIDLRIKVLGGLADHGLSDETRLFVNQQERAGFSLLLRRLRGANRDAVYASTTRWQYS